MHSKNVCVFKRNLTDTNLKNPLKATSFKMSVLNTVIINSVVIIQEQIDAINKNWEKIFHLTERN
jgi:hypothetical protein